MYSPASLGFIHHAPYVQIHAAVVIYHTDTEFNVTGCLLRNSSFETHLPKTGSCQTPTLLRWFADKRKACGFASGLGSSHGRQSIGNVVLKAPMPPHIRRESRRRMALFGADIWKRANGTRSDNAEDVHVRHSSQLHVWFPSVARGINAGAAFRGFPSRFPCPPPAEVPGYRYPNTGSSRHFPSYQVPLSHNAILLVPIFF